jgi:hypothetical protein
MATSWQQLLHQLAIAPDLTLQQPGYGDYTALPEAVARILASPLSLQTDFLAGHLQQYLYDAYFTGLWSAQSTPADLNNSGSRSQDSFANDAQGSMDSAFYRRLREANGGRGYYDPGWEVVGRDDRGRIATLKDGLRLWNAPDRVRPEQAGPGELVAIWMPHNLLSADRYVVVGEAGRPVAPWTQWYLNVAPDIAVTMVAQVSQQLNRMRVAFELAVEWDDQSYHRWEPVILRCAQADDAQVWLWLRAQLSDWPRREQVPVFIKFLGLGIGVAATSPEREDPGWLAWGAIGRGLAQAWAAGQEQPAERWQFISAVLAESQWSLEHMYLLDLATDPYESLKV